MKNSKKEKLAQELADTLDDRESIAFYRDVTKKYSEGFIRGKLQKVMSIPSNQIRKTRGALFTFLLNQYEHKHNWHEQEDDDDCGD